MFAPATPRWLIPRSSVHYNTRDAALHAVDPIKKNKAPLFDHAKMAAALTMITRIPYDAQHLPFTQVRFIKSDAAFEFEVQVPRDAVIPTTKPKPITTDQQGGGDEQSNEFDMVEDPEQQQQQHSQRPQHSRARPLTTSACGSWRARRGDGWGRGGRRPRARRRPFVLHMASAR